ncbi:hypothetical protein [Fundidesulfovibrio soli]|uniref:VgrG-related protein n=1 Tax=Fundidesulfovibrio soli TaxID=2922716 RepID=UPI001FAF7E00|nr:hypothetical protein [Fundidesulfovibrio soli]
MNAQPETPGPTARILSCLDPQSKRLLLGGALGYALCLWVVLCMGPRWPELTPPPRPDTLDMAGPMLNPVVARRLVQDMLQDDRPVPGEVRVRIVHNAVRRSIDFSALHPDDPAAWPRRAALTLWGKSNAVRRGTPTYTMACLMPMPGPGSRLSHQAPPGVLAARFESGDDGAASVGHTPKAGTSYGTFQIASGTPTYANFLRYLKERAPDLHARLQSQGPANTGSTSGPVAEEWRRIAEENRRRFESLQYEFILTSHYRPAVKEIFTQTGVDVSALSPATREVLWSAAVQHGVGGAAAIFACAINAVKPRIVEERKVNLFEAALIEEVYRQRLALKGHSPLLAKDAMLNRYIREKSQALGLLDRHYSGT